MAAAAADAAAEATAATAVAAATEAAASATEGASRLHRIVLFQVLRSFLRWRTATYVGLVQTGFLRRGKKNS